MRVEVFSPKQEKLPRCVFTYELSPDPLDDGPIRIQLVSNQRCSFGAKLKIHCCMHLIVPTVGLEPTLLSEPVPKTGASTNSAMRG